MCGDELLVLVGADEACSATIHLAKSMLHSDFDARRGRDWASCCDRLWLGARCDQGELFPLRRAAKKLGDALTVWRQLPALRLDVTAQNHLRVSNEVEKRIVHPHSMAEAATRGSKRIA